MKRGRGRMYLGVVAAACCAVLGYATAALGVGRTAPPLTHAQINAISSDLQHALNSEQTALRYVAIHAPTAAGDALQRSLRALGGAEMLTEKHDLGGSGLLSDVVRASLEDQGATARIRIAEKTHAERDWELAKGDIKKAIVAKLAAIGATHHLPEETTSSSESTGTSALEACAGQANATQDFVKVSYPGLAGATGGIAFSTSAGSQAKTFALSSSGIGFATGFTAPTSGFATITISLSTPSGPVSLNFTFPANSTPSSDCTLHK